MRNGKGSLQRPIGRISDAEMKREWKRIFGRTKRPRNKRAAIEAMRRADIEPTAKLTPEEFVERERANSAALGLTEGTPRIEELRHTSDCRCYACAPRGEQAVCEPMPEAPGLGCEGCGAAIGPEAIYCATCSLELGLPVVPLAPVTPDVPNQAPVAALDLPAVISDFGTPAPLKRPDRPHKVRRG